MKNYGNQSGLEILPSTTDNIQILREELKVLRQMKGIEKEEMKQEEKIESEHSHLNYKRTEKKKEKLPLVIAAILILAFFLVFFGMKFFGQSRSTPILSIHGSRFEVGKTTIGELEEQGFCMESFEPVGNIEAGEEKGYLMLEKEGVCLAVLSARNPSEKSLPLEECIVSSVKVEGISDKESFEQTDFRICGKSFYGLTQDGLKQVFLEWNKSMELFSKRRVIEGADTVYYCGKQKLVFTFEGKNISKITIRL